MLYWMSRPTFGLEFPGGEKPNDWVTDSQHRSLEIMLVTANHVSKGRALTSVGERGSKVQHSLPSWRTMFGLRSVIDFGLLCSVPQ